MTKQTIYPTADNIDDAVAKCSLRLPIVNIDQLRAVLMLYQNTMNRVTGDKNELESSKPVVGNK